MNKFIKYTILFSAIASASLASVSCANTHNDPLKTPAPTKYVQQTETPDNTPSPEPHETCSPTATATPFNTPEQTPIYTPTTAPTSAPTPTPSPAPEDDELRKAPAYSDEEDPDHSKELIISEAMSSNSSVYTDGGHYDYIEIYNCSDHGVNLGNYYLSDKKSEPQMCRLPDIILGSGEYYTFYCSGFDKFGHVPFKISSSGEKICLSDSEGIIDSFKVPGDLATDRSFGRYGTQLVYMVRPSINEANYAGHAERVLPPEASRESGQYDNAFYIELTADGTIRYTLDGTTPGLNSALYTGPVKIDHPTSLRAITVRDGEISETVNYSYIVGIDHTLPIVTVDIPEVRMYGDTGILSNPKKDYKTEAMITLYEEGTVRFSYGCQFKLHGNDSKFGRKQNFTVKFKSEYGPSKLKYKLFDNRSFDEFDSILLKSGSEDFPLANMRDELCEKICDDGATNLFVQAIKPAILYLNGQYWGIYYIRENITEEYVISHIGGSEESVKIVRFPRNLYAEVPEYEELVNYAVSHDMNVEEHYEYVMSKICSDELIDWYICRSFFADRDIDNTKIFKSDADGLWHWSFFDMDWAFRFKTDLAFKRLMDLNNESDPRDDLFMTLLNNQNFRTRLSERADELLTNVLTYDNINEKVNWFVSVLEPEIVRDRERWNCSMDEWYAEVEMIRDFYSEEVRADILRKELADLNASYEN